MNTTAKIAHNTIIQIISKIIATVLGLIAVAIMTRNLGQSGFGQYTTIITFLSFFGIIADLGLTLVTVQMISRPGIDENKILNNLFSLRFFSAVFFLGMAPIIIFFLPYDDIIKHGVIIASLSFLFIALNQILVGIFQKNLRMDKVSIAEITGRIILLLGIIITVKMNWGLTGILVATVFSSFINFIIHLAFSYKFVKIKFSFDFDVWKEIIKTTWPLATTIALNLIYLKTDTLILSLIKSDEEVGIYGAAYKVIDVLAVVPFMFAGIVLPVLIFNWVEKKIDHFKKSLQRSFDFMIILLIPLVVGIQLTADPIISLVAGEEFASAGSILKILSIAVGAIFLGCLPAHAIIALEKQKKVIKLYLIVSITTLIGYLIFIPKFSYFGAAWMTVYSELLIAFGSIYYVKKYSGFLPNLKIAYKATLASIIMAIFSFSILHLPLNKNVNLILAITLSCFIYFFLLYLLKAITNKDIKELLNKSS